ncbi:MAG: glycoside hydrolase family 65 protein [Abditibacteriota bacterium]|nr:glycoside hydrolase family 65 protein [Abditibacteriota bacterium]
MPKNPYIDTVKDDGYTLISEDPACEYGTYAGDGFMSARIKNKGWGDDTCCTFIAGLYDKENIVGLRSWAELKIAAVDKKGNRTEFDLNPKADYRQVVDMKHGVISTIGTWSAGRKHLTGRMDLYALRDKPGAAVMTLRLTPNFGGKIEIESSFAPREDNESLAVYETGEDFAVYNTKNSRIRIAVGKRIVEGEKKPGKETKSSKAEIDAAKNSPLTLSIVSAVDICHSWENKNVKAIVAGALDDVCGDIPAAVKSHEKTWEELWNTHDIIIEGDPDGQKAVRSFLFYLTESVREGVGCSVPPMGLSDAAFCGHVFWDADVWIFPTLLLMYPEYAATVVDYRYDMLPGAEIMARKDNMDGAQYPWESGYTGVEAAPEGIDYYHERHINGDVALAQWMYFLATGDEGWLKKRGMPVIKATADWWLSKAERTDRGYEILRVVPPDEDAGIKDNSVYTNAIAAMNLTFAARAARIVGDRVNPDWERVAENMYIPFDEKGKKYLNYDGYEDQTIKQADAELLVYPLQFREKDEGAAEINKNTYEFYKDKVNEKGPAMSRSAHAVIAARLGRAEEAFKLFEKSYKPYMRGGLMYFNEKAPKTYTNMYFMTGAAGTLNAVLYGFLGAKLDYDDPEAELEFKPALPKKWKSLTVKGISLRGETFDVKVTEAGTEKIAK